MDIRNQGIKIESRLGALDGWRGLSILLVLAAHLLPLGPKQLELNASAGVLGMVIFFTLSGFLITSTLLNNDSIIEFLIRRVFRIVPLAWLCAAIILYATNASADTYLANFLFYANWPPMWLANGTAHFWSLCVEMQFYLWIALLVLLFRRHWIYLIPLTCILITLYRIANGAHAHINTYYRADEILAGGILALIYNNKLRLPQIKLITKHTTQALLLLLVIMSCHPKAGALNYLRPYFAIALVAGSLLNPAPLTTRILNNKHLFYIASVSYALYVVHPLLTHTWLGSGDGIVKYSKRPLFFLVLFIAAHISTFHYEKWWINYGKKKIIELRIRRSNSATPTTNTH
jgi:peptidoglycan/LPS O-acetylase OafA/YrhL